MEIANVTIEGRPRAPLVVARGGDVDAAPSHTIAALEAALERGADALELGVRLSRDGHPVAFGAARLDGATEARGPLGALTVRELKRLDAGAFRDARLRGQRIQTLHEVLERFRDRTRIWLELPAGEDAALAQRVVSTLGIYDAVEWTVVGSAEVETLAAIAEMDSGIRLARIWNAGRAEDAAASAGLCGAVWIDAELVSPPGVALIRGAGLECHARMRDEPALADRLVESDVDGIVTDRPGAIRARLGRR